MDLLEKVQMENLDEEQKALAELIGLEAFKNLVTYFHPKGYTFLKLSIYRPYSNLFPQR